MANDQQQRFNPFRYLREVREELGKVTWPKRQEVIQGTIRVILVSLVFAIVLGVVDYGAQRGLDKLLTRVPATSTSTTSTAPKTTP
ncbi:MAG: preprotein translocase subunit SecE [Candidatus Andersenbacteria bacterium]